MNIKKFLVLAVFPAMMMGAWGAHAAHDVVIGFVQAVLLTSDDSYGGCMANISDDPAAKLAGCSPGWVSFSCTGDYNTELRAFRMLDQAQLALATNKRVRLIFHDDRKHNGYCFASRIDVLR